MKKRTINWEAVHNPGFNYGEFDTIRSQAGRNSYLADYCNRDAIIPVGHGMPTMFDQPTAFVPN